MGETLRVRVGRPLIVGTVLVAWTAALGVGPASAQTGMRTQAPAAAQVGGAIDGRVVDAAGTGVRGTAVTARDTATGFTRTVITTQTGAYRIEGLPSGTYTVTATVAGFTPSIVSGVVVGAGGTAMADFALTATASDILARGDEPPSGRMPRVELGARVGWTLADGVSGDEYQAADGNRYDRVDPQDSASVGLSFGVFLTENAEIEFLFGRQSTTLEASGTQTVEIGDVSIDTYHGLFAYNWGPGRAAVRPYVFFGLGMTRYGDVTFTAQDQQRTIDGGSRFSTTFGGGVKAYFGALGVRFEGRLTPTYIKSDDTSWWCDPYWGCYVVGDAQYANQFEISGGISVRF
jgi:hypothetical protein